MARPYFPMFVDLSQRRALVVGAGHIAARRARVLTDFCGDITVVAPRVDPALEGLGLNIRRRPFEAADLEGMDIVIAATDDAALNADIARRCRELGIPVNVVSDRSLCDFYFPGVALRGDVAVGVTASGADHRLARRVTMEVRRAIEEMVLE